MAHLWLTVLLCVTCEKRSVGTTRPDYVVLPIGKHKELSCKATDTQYVMLIRRNQNQEMP
ncbi:hypothetical protein IC582_026783 [Cucumis melo]